MKKITLLIIISLISFTLQAQNVPDLIRTTPVPATGANKNNRATVDANLKASLAFLPPVGDAYSLNGAKDSVGYLFYNRILKRLGAYRGGGIWDNPLNVVTTSYQNLNINEKVQVLTDGTANFGKSLFLPQGSIDPGVRPIYGPYLGLENGEYTYKFYLKINSNLTDTARFLHVDIAENGNSIMSTYIRYSDFLGVNVWTPFRIVFNGVKSRNYECRIDVVHGSDPYTAQYPTKTNLWYDYGQIIGIREFVPTDLGVYALDANVVHKTGNETLGSGIKTFNDVIQGGGNWSIAPNGQAAFTGVSTGNMNSTNIINSNSIYSPFFTLTNTGPGGNRIILSAPTITAGRDVTFQDKNGVVALTSDLTGLATDANALHKTLDETARGDKTLKGSLTIQKNILIQDTLSSNAWYLDIENPASGGNGLTISKTGQPYFQFLDHGILMRSSNGYVRDTVLFRSDVMGKFDSTTIANKYATINSLSTIGLTSTITGADSVFTFLAKDTTGRLVSINTNNRNKFYNKLKNGTSVAMTFFGDSELYGYMLGGGGSPINGSGSARTLYPVPETVGALFTTAGYANTVSNLAYPGDRTNEMLVRMGSAATSDLAVIAIGTNDANNFGVLPAGPNSIYKFKKNLRLAVQLALSRGSYTVLLVEPDLKSEAANKKLDAYKSSIIEVGLEFNVPVVDANEGLKPLGNIWSDGVHLTDISYPDWAGSVASFLLNKGGELNPSVMGGDKFHAFNGLITSPNNPYTYANSTVGSLIYMGVGLVRPVTINVKERVQMYIKLASPSGASEQLTITYSNGITKAPVAITNTSTSPTRYNVMTLEPGLRTLFIANTGAGVCYVDEIGFDSYNAGFTRDGQYPNKINSQSAADTVSIAGPVKLATSLVIGEGTMPDAGFNINERSNTFGNNRFATYSNTVTNSSALNLAKARGTYLAPLNLKAWDRVAVLSFGAYGAVTNDFANIGRIRVNTVEDITTTNGGGKLWIEMNAPGSQTAYPSLIVNGANIGIGDTASVVPLSIKRDWTTTGGVFVGAGIGQTIAVTQTGASNLTGVQINSVSSNSASNTGIDITADRGANVGNFGVTGINVAALSGARASSSTQVTDYGIRSVLTGSRATTSTATNKVYTSVYGEANSVTAVGEVSIVEGVHGKATGLTGMTTKGIVAEASGGTTNYGIDVVSGTLHLTPLTASQVVLTDANKNLSTTATLPVANGGTGVATITGIVRGNGTGAFTAAVQGTDFLSPSGVATVSNKTFNGLRLNYNPQTANYAALTTDYYIDCTANTFTVTLPSAATGITFVVANNGAGTITVQGTGGQLVNGAATYNIAAGSTYEFYGTGTQYRVKF